jgi:type I restriction enzyme, S subunit
VISPYDGWKKIRLKHISKNIGQYGANLSAGNYLENGVRFLRTTDIQENGELITSEKGAYVDKSLIRDYLLQSDDILFSRSGTLGRSYLHKNNTIGDFAFAGYLVRFRLNHLVHPKFIFYVSKSSEFSAQIEADAIQSTISNFNGEKYGNIGILIPPLETQQSIARFLDRKTAAIDTLITKKQRLIQLLEEKRTALINQAVTKGLNPIAPMKDSGIPWIGETPEHWKILKLGIFAEVTKLTGFEYTNHWIVHPNGEIIALRGFNIKNGKLVLNDVEKISSKLSSKLFRSKLFSGDIVFPCTGTIGNGALIEEDNKFHINQNIAKITARKNWDIHPKYFLNQLCDYAMKYQIDSLNSSGIQPVLLIGTIRNLVCVLPDIEEQRIISDYIDDQNKRFDKISNNLFSQIEKLQEYRRSLITAAVTGKLAISEVEPDV